MSNNPQKTPFAKTLPAFATGVTGDVNALIGKSIPASIVSVDETNTIVTVKFDVQLGDETPLPQRECAVACPQWMRWPIQVGDKGVVFSSDYYIAAQSGLGDGDATLDQLPNLSNLVWVPLGNTKFDPPPFPKAMDTNGPDGAVMRSTDNAIQVIALKDNGFQIKWNGTPFLTISKDGIAMQFDGMGIVINSLGTFIDGASLAYLFHEHSGVQPGGGNTGPVVP